MSSLASKSLVVFGKYADATTFSGTPGTLMHLMPERHTFVPPDMVRLRREAQNPQNVGMVPLRGPIDIGKTYELEQILRGLSGNNGGAIDPEATTDVARVLDVVAGTDSIDPSGAAASATGGTGASKILGVDEQARFPIGTVVRFTVDSGTPVVRQVRARAGSSGAGNLTLDRTFSGTVDAATVVRCARWKFDPAVFEHVHGYVRVQNQHDGRNYIAGMCTAVLDFARGMYGKLVTSWQFTDVTDNGDAVATFSEPTAGSGLVRLNNSFWIGDSIYYATNLRVECGGERVPRNVDDGLNGVLGFTVQKGEGKPRPKISVTLLRGSNTGEVLDSSGTLSMNKAQAWDKSVGDPTATFDIAFQVGTAAGALGYGVMFAGCITKAEQVPEDGLHKLQVEIEATGTDTNLAPFELHLG